LSIKAKLGLLREKALKHLENPEVRKVATQKEAEVYNSNYKDLEGEILINLSQF